MSFACDTCFAVQKKPNVRRLRLSQHGLKPLILATYFFIIYIYRKKQNAIIEGSLEVKLPTIWTDEKQSREEAERRERLEERIVEEKE